MQKTKGEILDINTRCSFLLLLESVNKRQKQGKFLGIDDVEEATQDATFFLEINEQKTKDKRTFWASMEATQDASLSGGLQRSEGATVRGGGTTGV